MNKYFAEFVKKHGGDNVFSEKIGISRQAVGNLKRGVSRASEKVIIEIEKQFSDFDRTMYLSGDGLLEYIQEIQSLRAKIQELEMKNRMLEENQKMWIGAIVGSANMGKFDGVQNSQLVENLMLMQAFQQSFNGNSTGIS